MKIGIIGSLPLKKDITMTAPQRYNFNLTKALMEHSNINVDFILRHRNRHFYKRPINGKLDIINYYKISSLFIKSFLKKKKYDIIIVTGVSPFGIKPLKLKNNTKIIYNPMGSVLREYKLGFSYPKRYITYQQEYLLKSDGVNFGIQYLKDILIKDYNIISNNQIIIPGGIDDIFFKMNSSKDRIKQCIGLSNKKILLYVGYLSYLKGLDFLLNTYKNFKYECILIIIGNKGPGSSSKYFNILKEKICRIKQQKKIIHVKRFPFQLMPYLYKAAECLICPSRFDSGPLTGLESMAVGTPLIITNKCGIKNIVKKSKSGFIVPFGDTKKLNQYISKILSDKQIREKMSKAAKLTTSKISWKEIAIKYSKYLEKIL